MQLITCPWCGPREEVEFHYGGQAHVAYPAEPATVPGTAWAQFLFFRDNPRGPVRRAMEPRRRLPPLVQRHPRHRHPPVPGRLPAGRAETGDLMSPVHSADRCAPRPAAGSTGTPPCASPSTAMTCSDYRGDTLASALLANGVHQVATSIIYGRPRGIMAAGLEDANALVQVDQPYSEPMLTATTVPLTDGLVAHGLPGQGRWIPRRHRPLRQQACAHRRPRHRRRTRRAHRRPAAARSGARVILSTTRTPPAVPCSAPMNRSTGHRPPTGSAGSPRNSPPTRTSCY